jgi:catechol 2,3-dioxygenase-like lactoylglutathione lyase family enzyme
LPSVKQTRRKSPKGVFKRLVYVYVGTSDYSADYDFYKNVLGAERVWEFERFGAKVAAFDLCGEP